MTDYKNLKLIASSSPHIRSNEDTRSIMLDVIIALLPALAWSVYCFGWKALLLTAVSVVSCVFFEWAYRKVMKKSCMVGDLSNMSPGYALEYFEDAHYYLILIKPVSKAVQAYINQIQIYLDKKDMSVHKLRLSETATNYTEYEFSDKKFNSLKDETKFTIR